MEANELLKKVRKIEIVTRGLSKHVFAGEYHSIFKGRGMAFSEVREYQFGDDVRNIDWNVTARFNRPFIKIFEEERELTVMLLVDVSASEDSGTRTQLKRDLITNLSAVLSFSAIENNDKVGVIFFSDKIEKFITPKKGRTHILHIIRELVDFKPSSKGTNIADSLRFLTSVIKKRATCFLISDFLDSGFADALRITNHKHDVIALRIYDTFEADLPKSCFQLRIKGAENAKVINADLASFGLRKTHHINWVQHAEYLRDTFTKSGVDNVAINTDDKKPDGDYVKQLLQLFKRRGLKK